MLTVLFIVTGLLLLITLLPLSYSQHYLIRSCDFVRLQVCYLASAVIIVALIGMWQIDFIAYSLVAVVAFVILVLQAKWIYPYTWFAKKEVLTAPKSSDHSIRILCANVLMSNRHSEQLINLVDKYQPDLLITLESDSWWQDKLSVLKKTTLIKYSAQKIIVTACMYLVNLTYSMHKFVNS